MKRATGKFRPRRRSGAAILETALILPVLLLLSFGLVEFGHFFYVQHNLTAAAREGVRTGIISGRSEGDVAAAVGRAMTAARLQNSGYTVVTSPANLATAPEGAEVQVTVRCNWGTVGLRPLKLISASRVVSATAVMRREGT